MKAAKRVSFGKTQKVYGDPHNLSKEARKHLCWCSEADLEDSRIDAKMAIEALQEANGNFEAVDESICIRGIEKYGDVIAIAVLKKRLINSVLAQQNTNRTTGSTSGEQNLAVISRILSQPATQIAQIHATDNALIHDDQNSSKSQSLRTKRLRSTCYDETIHRRTVKPCFQSCEYRR
jgi:hypothetical protein